MNLFRISFFLICLIVGAMFISSLILFKRIVLKDSYLKSFECGFTLLNDMGIEISIRYYHMLVVFLLMDVEVVLLFFSPYVYIIQLNYIYGVLVLVIVIYLVGLLYELKIGGLS